MFNEQLLEGLTLSTPETFPTFPYSPPYGIQTDLMRHLYQSIEARKMAIVESPTGTGKTLSLLCGSLSWLKDEQNRARKGQLAELEKTMKGDTNEPKWVLEQTLEFHRRELEAVEHELTARLESARNREEALKRKEQGRARKKAKLSHSVGSKDQDDDDFLPEDVLVASSADDEYSHLSPDVRELLRKAENASKPEPVRDLAEQDPVCTKIYYASRTHTQLSQTISELNKTTYKTSIRTVPLGSRRNLCINDDLKARVGTGGELDEACRVLMTEKKGSRCPHMPEPGDETKMPDFRDHILATPRDIEDLFQLGKDLNTCPYYGSRKAINQAELVILPYNLLLQKHSRDVLGIDLQNQVVIVDEAHNLIDTILSTHTVPLNHSTLRAALSQLSIYLNKFKTRLSPKNALHLRRLVLFLATLDKFCAEWSQGDQGDAMFDVRAFVSRLGDKVQDVNLLEVDKYLRESKIARKISGYCEKVAETAEEARAKGGATAQNRSKRALTTPPLHAVEAFLLSLTNASEDGRIFISKQSASTPSPNNQSPSVLLKYQLLNPTQPFRSILNEARSVILAGGTMQPVGDFKIQLFAGGKKDDKVKDFEFFGCGHVIPEENLKALVIQRGPQGGEMLWKFDKRGDRALMTELGQLMLNLVNVVPDGMVVFFPSYAFLNSAKAMWTENGLLAKLSAKKQLFYEPQESGEVEVVLRDYATAIRSPVGTIDHATKTTSGALLLAVVGAKLSEGLNFTDELARAVVLVGLPFANLGSVELKERMKYVTELGKRHSLGASETSTKTGGGRDAGQELYENLCMKAVNQSIGRAIRHRNDWAALILVDTRYSTPRIRAKLPAWIGKDIVVAEKFGQAMKELGNFYRARKRAAIA